MNNPKSVKGIKGSVVYYRNNVTQTNDYKCFNIL